MAFLSSLVGVADESAVDEAGVEKALVAVQEWNSANASSFVFPSLTPARKLVLLLGGAPWHLLTSRVLSSSVGHHQWRLGCRTGLSGERRAKRSLGRALKHASLAKSRAQQPGLSS